MDTGPSHACPGAEILAEYLEGGLPPERRQRIEDHLAECGDCCASFANSALYLQGKADEEELETDFPVKRRLAAARGPLAAGVAGVVIGMAIQAGIGSWSHSPPKLPEPQHAARLVAAGGTARPSLPRFTGDFAWPPPAIDSTSALGPRRGRNQLATAATTQLLAGQLDAGVESLVRAAAASPQSAALASDLGAALLARDETGDDAEDLAAGLEAIENALASRRACPRRCSTVPSRSSGCTCLSERSRRGAAISKWTARRRGPPKRGGSSPPSRRRRRPTASGCAPKPRRPVRAATSNGSPIWWRAFAPSRVRPCRRSSRPAGAPLISRATS